MRGLLIRRDVCLLLLVLVTAMGALGATAERTIYSQTPNKELKQKALRLVKNIRELVRSYNQKDRELTVEYDRKNRSGSTAGAAKALRDQWLKQTDELHDSTMQKYKALYWADAILLADEIYRRPPKQKRQTNILPIFQHPTNVLGLQAIADHLDLIAKSLPD
jgi:hypothetical protein